MSVSVRQRWLVIGVLSVLAAVVGRPEACFGQASLADSLRVAFESMRYDRLQEIAARILKEPAKHSPEELVSVHNFLALAAFNQGRASEARVHFESILSLDPDFEPDPLYASPKARSFFQQIKRNWQPKKQLLTSPVRYVLVTDLRPGAAWRSLLLPGWGHLYRREKRTGIALLAATGLAAASTAAAHLFERRARSDYLEAKDPGDITTKFDRYNRYYRLRHYSLGALVTIWLGAYLDASLRPAGNPTVSAPAGSRGAVALTVHFPF